MGFVRSPDCYLDLHQISAIVHTTHDTKYTRSVRLGWDQPDMHMHTHMHMHMCMHICMCMCVCMSVRSMVWLQGSGQRGPTHYRCRRRHPRTVIFTEGGDPLPTHTICKKDRHCLPPKSGPIAQSHAPHPHPPLPSGTTQVAHSRPGITQRPKCPTDGTRKPHMSLLILAPAWPRGSWRGCTAVAPLVLVAMWCVVRTWWVV